MRLITKKSFVGSYFVGRFCAADRQAAIEIKQGIGGFDTREQADEVVENLHATSATDTYFVVQVVGEYRVRTQLVEVDKA